MFYSVAAVFFTALSVLSGGQAAPSGLVARQAYQGQGELTTNDDITTPSIII
jgi:hypothetical protein